MSGLFFLCKVLKSVNADLAYCLKVYYCSKASTLKYWEKVKQQLKTNKPQ